MTYLFTSESVSNGHPDKICDQISDSILDAILAQDRNGRVAVETVASGKQIHVLGEINTKAELDVPHIKQIVRNTLNGIGYDKQFYGADFEDDNDVLLNVSINQQSPDISQGVEHSLEDRSHASLDKYDSLGAGDQGIMFGFATSELKRFKSDSESYMPAAIQIAHQIAHRHAELRTSGDPSFVHFGPDAKTQVTLEYVEGVPVRVDTVLVSTQHTEEIDNDTIHDIVRNNIIVPILDHIGIPHNDTRYIINPSGRFVIGGPVGDAGLTGRKIVVDTYGGYAPHGGGAFSGKDPSKVDRSAAYAARWVAKNLVANGLAKHATVQLSYAIGSAHPVSINVKSDNSFHDDALTDLIREKFDLRPAAIIERLSLDTFTNYKQTAAFGHFGRTDIDLPWEQIIEL